MGLLGGAGWAVIESEGALTRYTWVQRVALYRFKIELCCVLKREGEGELNKDCKHFSFFFFGEGRAEL